VGFWDEGFGKEGRSRWVDTGFRLRRINLAGLAKKRGRAGEPNYPASPEK